MKRLLTGLILFPLTLLLFGCGVSIKYTSRKDFKNENEKERKELYKDVLSSIDVDTVDKFALMYIDYIMTESDRFKTLEKMNPTDNFSKFFLEAIPILYYSYSPATYKSVPKEWNEKTKNYILSQTPYPFNKGEQKYRKWFEKQLKKDIWYVFPFYDKDEPEKYALGNNEYENFPLIIATDAWNADFNYSDFKSLDKSSQASLLRFTVLLKYINNGNTVDDDFQKGLEGLEKQWEKKANEFLENPKFAEMENDTSFPEVFGIAFNLIRDSFRN